jgi:hypothetical protein
MITPPSTPLGEVSFMDEETLIYMAQLGVDPRTIPPRTVKLFQREQLFLMGDDAIKWARHEQNAPALGYEIETEFKRHVGFVLRNLHPNKPQASHYTVTDERELPLWHNWSFGLPLAWSMGVLGLVEGPKDARVLHGHGLPVVAYLGPAPSTDHLRTAKRYVHTVMWIPDNEPLTPQVARRRQGVIEAAKSMGLQIRQLSIPVKDPALLAHRTQDVADLKRRFLEASRIGGGGFRGMGPKIPS